MTDMQVRVPVGVDRATLWQATIDAFDAPVFLVDGERRIVGANERAHELAQQNGNLIGSGLGCLGDDIYRCLGELLAEISPSVPAASRQMDERASGVTWDVSVRSVDVRGTLVFMRDVTNLVALESTARRNERVAEMGRLVANVAHEVRNPLFSMSATVDALEARLGSVQPLLARYVGPLRHELRRITDLMQDLLEYGKPPVLDSAVTALSGPIADAVATVAERARVRNIVISNSTSPCDGRVLVDRARVAQAFQNVLENAIQHTPVGGSVSVAAARIEAGGRKWLCCAVEDSGPGFTDEGLSLLFEPFYTTRPGGTGLGLSIVKRIVDIHGGRTFAGNRDEGGARISVWLPLREEA